jgi:hypothetical protein
MLDREESKKRLEEASIIIVYTKVKDNSGEINIYYNDYKENKTR